MKKNCLLFLTMAAVSPAQSLPQRSRQMQSSAVYPPMAGYQPNTDVTDEVGHRILVLNFLIP